MITFEEPTTTPIQQLRDALKRLGMDGQDLDWEIITICVRLKGLNMAQLGFDAGLGITTIAQTKYRHMPRYEAAIAKALGVPAAELWPERYRPRVININGNPEAP